MVMMCEKLKFNSSSGGNACLFRLDQLNIPGNLPAGYRPPSNAHHYFATHNRIKKIVALNLWEMPTNGIIPLMIHQVASRPHFHPEEIMASNLHQEKSSMYCCRSNNRYRLKL
jgi:hypothetical protein